jgi:uncharacterized protein with HEPN domain
MRLFDALRLLERHLAEFQQAHRKKYNHLPWQAMKGTRNKVIHEYDSIKLDIIWDIVQKDLPDLVRELEKIVPAM